MPRESSARWFSATVAPARAKASTVASPMPEAPPVTSAVLPVRSAVIMAGSLAEKNRPGDCVAVALSDNEKPRRHGEHGGKNNRIPGESRDPLIGRSNGRPGGSRLSPGMRCLLLNLRDLRGAVVSFTHGAR